VDVDEEALDTDSENESQEDQMPLDDEIEGNIMLSLVSSQTD
jgi:hypothetical protein